MVKFKRGLAIFLASTMMFTIVGCGKSDSDDKEKKGSGKKGDSVSTLADALASADNYTSGDYTLKALVDAGEYGKIEFNSDGTIAGNDCTFGMSFAVESSGQEVEVALDDVFVVSGDYLYINIDSVIEVLSDVETEFGYYKIMMPETDDKAGEKLQEISKDFINAALEDIDVEEESDGTVFTAEIKKAEDYEKLVRNVVKYIDENQDEIQKAYEESLNAIDYKSYLKDVLEDMSDDIMSAVEALGGTVSDDDIQAIIDSVDDIELEDAEINLFEGFEEIKESVEDMDSDDFEEAFEEVEVVSTIKVTASEEEFAYEIGMEAEADGEKIEIAIEYSLKVDEDAKVSAPKNVLSLTDMVDYAMDNQDVLADVVEGINDKWGDIVGDVDIDDWDDDWDDDDYDDDDWGTVEVGNGAISLDGDEWSINLNGKDFTFSYDDDLFDDVECDDDAIFFDGSKVSASLFLWEDFEFDSVVEYYAESYGDDGYNTYTVQGCDVAAIGTDENSYYLVVGSRDMGDNCFVVMVYFYDEVTMTPEELADAFL